MSKWTSPWKCIWHVDQVGQTPGQVSSGAGRPTRVWVSSARGLVDTSLCRFTRNDLRLEGGGGLEEWPADHVDCRSAVHLLQTNLAKSVETPLCPYISPPMVEDSTTHSTCSSPLVKVRFSSSSTGEALSRVKSLVKFCSSSGSSLKDRWALVSLLFFIDFES
jgi:hypothetical protein